MRQLEHLRRALVNAIPYYAMFASNSGTGLGLAVVARIVEQLGGQLRVDSRIDEGSRFSFLIPFTTDPGDSITSQDSRSPSTRSLESPSEGARGHEIDNLVQAFSNHHLVDRHRSTSESGSPAEYDSPRLDEARFRPTSTEPEPSSRLLTPEGDLSAVVRRISRRAHAPSPPRSGPPSSTSRSNRSDTDVNTKLRLLIVEVRESRGRFQ